MSEDVDLLKQENMRLNSRIKMLENPFELENASIANINIDDLAEDINSVRVARINDCEFINGGLYMALISKHFNEVHDGILMRMIANRMASAIEEANSNGTATKNMIDSLKQWNNIMYVNEQPSESQKN